ncbi:hypothetical protein FRC98_00160 [Lujinxingia vulgaris]|uniref:Uncharacterized protein n=1 Tax=Lujinxingia vulgaris TaxID=2600176 RepID=A0A5C6XMM8_9DELT|nr:hypothetical protein [Lujinxingia vulgaris]TXD38852.1 hypothetical protein FRC98_00160 [Lujinxingia vulgaris]
MSEKAALTQAEQGFAAAWVALRSRGGGGADDAARVDPSTSAPLSDLLQRWLTTSLPESSALTEAFAEDGPAASSEPVDSRVLMGLRDEASLLQALTRIGGFLIASMRPQAPLRPLMELTLGLDPTLAMELRGWLLSPPALGEGLSRRVRESYVRLIGRQRRPDQVAEFGLYFVMQPATLRHPSLAAHLRARLGGRLRARLNDFGAAALRSSQAELLPSIEDVIASLARRPAPDGETAEMKEVDDA